ncbi:hypothetical protein BV22DRAFT_1122973 [Leucogyrophana mollusca]|uniref:Uncharacterized protein n=1 Tax=Leucogyrophana mollusca TaxID=85980 RepID=A0ACB8B3I2_9AGAM|nr:hypothetical protein BV22DRAFT_1122973 [Leucogyrophana mollusca]
MGIYVYGPPTTGAVSFADFCVNQSPAGAYAAHLAEATQARANLHGVLNDSKRIDRNDKDYLKLVKARTPPLLSSTLPTSRAGPGRVAPAAVRRHEMRRCWRDRTQIGTKSALAAAQSLAVRKPLAKSTADAVLAPGPPLPKSHSSPRSSQRSTSSARPLWAPSRELRSRTSGSASTREAVGFLAWARRGLEELRCGGLSFQPVLKQCDLQARIPAGSFAVVPKPYAPPRPAFGPGSAGREVRSQGYGGAPGMSEGGRGTWMIWEMIRGGSIQAVMARGRPWMPMFYIRAMGGVYNIVILLLRMSPRLKITV